MHIVIAKAKLIYYHYWTTSRCILQLILESPCICLHPRPQPPARTPPPPHTPVHVACKMGTLEHHWKNLVQTAPHWNATGETLTITTYTGTLREDYTSPHTQAHIVKQSSIHDTLKWQDDGTPSSKWTGLCKFSFYLEFTAFQYIPFLLFKRLSTSTSPCACLGYEHHYSFCWFLGCSTNEIRLAQTTLAILVVYIRGCILGSDLT